MSNDRKILIIVLKKKKKMEYKNVNIGNIDYILELYQLYRKK